MYAFGGEAWFASDIDTLARRVYRDNWGLVPKGNIVPLTETDMLVPKTDVLCAGFPCQPFSKSGKQRGMQETRGTLFFNICKILDAQQPKVILLENVRNLAGPRQRQTWDTIIVSLRDLGYRVSSKPAVFSPHLLPPKRGGRPQVRERVFITGTHVGRERAWAETDFDPIVSMARVDDFDPKLEWNLARDLPLDPDEKGYRLGDAERRWIACWNDWLSSIDEGRLPGFPIWADEFRYPAVIPAGTPRWKAEFLRKNADLYERNRAAIDAWRERWDDLRAIPPSRRKLEWQAQDTERNLYQCVLHFRPSGIRAKKPNYVPALVAITQTSVVPVADVSGQVSRRISPREAARLQGLPEWFDFGAQPEAATYRQLGNGVSVGAAYHVFREHVLHERERCDIPERIVSAVEDAPLNPDDRLRVRPGSSPLESNLRGTLLGGNWVAQPSPA